MGIPRHPRPPPFNSSDFFVDRLDAFFRVDPDEVTEESWQEFPLEKFHTHHAAAANALAKAEQSLDLAIAAAH